MEKSKIDASIKEAVIAEVKKLTGYAPKSPNKLHQFLNGNFSVKYVHDHYLRIANGDIGVMFTPKALPDDLIWQKAAEMLKIAVEVPEPRRTKVFNHLWALAQQYLAWRSFEKKVDPKDEGISYVKFWGEVKRTYGEGVPSNELSNWIEAKAESEAGLTRREYLDLIVDEILAQADATESNTQSVPDTYPQTVFPDKSVGYFFNQLKEPLRTKALSQAKNLSEPAESLDWALNTWQILPWDDTVEGSSFWSGVWKYFTGEQSGGEGSKMAEQCAPDNYVFPNPPKKEAPEYVPPTPPVNPIEQALAEIAELRTRVEVIEHVKDVEIKALRNNHAEMELDSKTLANLAYNRVSAFIGQGITPSQQDFEHWWTEFRKENGYATGQPTESEYIPTPDQIYALWLLVKDGDKSFPNAIPYKVAAHKFQPSVLQVEVQDNFEFTVSPTKFYPLINSKGERPTFAQCRQAVAGTLFTNLQTLFNDQTK